MKNISDKPMTEFHSILTFFWQNHYWIKRPLWGTVHPDDYRSYMDEDLPYVENGDLVLPVKRMKKPREGRPFGRSVVRTVEQFKYGTFEWEVILPSGEYVWPALWLSSDQGWPPEIDALEGWSGNSPNYIKRLLFKNIKPTMHWSGNADEKTGKHKSETKDNVWRWLIKDGASINKIKVVWTPNYVDVYYNGIKVKRFNDPEMLKHFNKEGYKMHAKMSMNIYGEPWILAAKGEKEDPKITRDFVVKSFKYYPL